MYVIFTALLKDCQKLTTQYFTYKWMVRGKENNNQYYPFANMTLESKL